jgi:type II secretory pathway pseudopilin PulG
MTRKATASNGFTLYQLLVSIIVVVIAASLGMAYRQGQRAQPATSSLNIASHG